MGLSLVVRCSKREWRLEIIFSDNEKKLRFDQVQLWDS